MEGKMKNKVIWLGLSILMIVAMLLASCSASTSTSALTSTSTSISTPSSTTASKPTTTSTTTTTNNTTTTATNGNWWDSLGKPQYGGTVTLRIPKDLVAWDPYYWSTGGLLSGWLEKLHTDDWTLNPSVFPYLINYRPDQYCKGELALSWEFSDPSTEVFHLRQGIHWQNIPPANGREFIADDVVFHFDREYGLGDGFTKPSPYSTALSTWAPLTSVTATDKYTVVFKWNTPNPEYIEETMETFGFEQLIECPDVVKQYGNTLDWHHTIGTGAFILTDFVSGAAATMVKNPDYWGHDARYPQNSIPYIDKLVYLIIPDDATAMAAMRTGKIDAIDQIQVSDAQSMKKTNPEILQFTVPLSQGITLDPRNDVKPFNDIRVRQAMQMAIDLPTIANTLYAGICDPNPFSLTSKYMTGYGFPYDQWPQDLKDQYAYNPTTAKQLLTAAGYPNGFNTNVVYDNVGSLDEIQVVKAYLAVVGINMDIRLMDDASWTSYVQTGKKEDQMSMRNIQGSTGLTVQPIRQLLNFATGSAQNRALVSDPVFDAYYPKAMASSDINNTLKIFKDANEYVARQHYVVSLLQPSLYVLSQPWFKGYNGQSQAIGGGQSGPKFTSFYLARFWIDQNVKRGH